MTLLSNCIGLLLKWTPEIIYLQKSAVNSPITIHFDSVLDPPSHSTPNLKILFLKIHCNYISLGTKYDVLQFESSLCCFFLHLADSAGVCTGVRGQGWCHVI